MIQVSSDGWPTEPLSSIIWESPDYYFQRRDEWSKCLQESATKFTLLPTNFTIKDVNNVSLTFKNLKEAIAKDIKPEIITWHYLENIVNIETWIAEVEKHQDDKTNTWEYKI